MDYGISMSVCLAKAKELAVGNDLNKTYLNFLDYFTAFASKNGFKTIEIASFPPFDADVLNQIKGEIKEKIKNFETIYHLPSWEINICALNPSVRKASVDETKKLIDLAKYLGIKKVSMHPGCYMAMSDLYVLLGQQVKYVAQKSILDIFEHCKNNGIELCLENLPGNEPFFQKPEEFETIIGKGVSMLVDTAHAVTSNIDPVDFVRKFCSKISEVHLVDGFRGQTDLHHALGTADVNYPAFLDELIKINYKGPIILELKSEKDVHDSLDILKKKGYYKN